MKLLIIKPKGNLNNCLHSIVMIVCGGYPSILALYILFKKFPFCGQSEPHDARPATSLNSAGSKLNEDLILTEKGVPS